MRAVERTICIFVFLWLSNCAFSSEQDWKDYSLVLAKPVSVKFKSELSTENEVYAGQLYEVEIVVQKVIKGDLKKERVTVDLVASHKSVLISKDSIFVLLEVNKNQIRSISWSNVRTIACFSNDLLANTPLSDSFKIKDDQMNAGCISGDVFN